MGIKGLETYMEQSLKGTVCYSVSIEKIVQEFAETNGCSPLILIDAPSTLTFLTEGLDWVCGGQYSEYEKIVVNFVSTIRKCGAEPVFFFDGPCQAPKRELWVRRRVSKFHYLQLLMKKIRKGEIVEDKKGGLLPTGYEKYVLTEMCRCKVVTSAKECDEEIAAYAKSEANVVAIMAQDSDFLIYNAAPYYLSSKHLDLTDLSTKVYSSSEFANVHKFDAKWLPVVGALLGNDYIPLDVLREFYQRVTNGRQNKNTYYISFDKVIPAVSEFICEHLSVDMTVEEMAGVIAPHLTQRREQKSKTEQLVCNALRSYFLMNCDSGITDSAPETYKEKLLSQLRKSPNFSPMAVQVLENMFVEHNNALEDLTSELNTFKASVLIYRGLNSRYIGLLLNHERSSLGDDFCIDEYSVLSDDSVIQQVKISFPPFEVDLLSMCCSNDPASRSSKLRTLFWAVTGNDQSEHCYQSELETKLFRVDPKLFICALLLFYLHKVERVLQMPEVELFISLFVHLDSISQHEQQPHLGYRELRTDPNYTAVHLATLFNRGIQAVGRVVSALGPLFPSSSFAQSNFFDGVLFQKIFLKEVVPSFECERARTIKSDFLDFIKCSYLGESTSQEGM